MPVQPVLFQRSYGSPVLGLVLGLVLAGCKGGPTPKLGPNEPVEARGMTLAGEALDLGADYAGRPVLLNLWASWCGPCKLEFPELVALHKQHKAKGLVFLGVNVDSHGQQKRAKAVQQRFALPFPSILDPSSALSNRLGTSALPTTLLLDAQHKVVWRHEGLLRADNPSLAEALKKVL